jgi:hypothetical protein
LVAAGSVHVGGGVTGQVDATGITVPSGHTFVTTTGSYVHGNDPPTLFALGSVQTCTTTGFTVTVTESDPTPPLAEVQVRVKVVVLDITGDVSFPLAFFTPPDHEAVH